MRGYTHFVAALSRATPLFRGKGKILRFMFPSNGIFRGSVGGLQMTMDLGEYHQRCMVLGLNDREEVRMMEAVLRPGMTFVDVGANVGQYTAVAARLVTAAGRVVAIEPSEYAFDRLEHWVAKNGLDHVTTLNVALSDHEGGIVLHLPPDGAANHNPSVFAYSNDMTPQRVVARPMPHVLTELGIEYVDLLKIDVEGHEPQVFQGAESFVAAGGVGHLICEFNDRLLEMAGWSSRRLLDYLRTLGFDLVTPATIGGRFCNALLAHQAARGRVESRGPMR